MAHTPVLQLTPWVQGPHELINHAIEHLNKGGDIDRRMALIGFDNAIEVCIDIYLNLPQEVRDDIQITRDEAEKARNNFYSKVEFLKRLFREKKITNLLPFKDIIWYHNLRNELYHSGNGMVPELYVIEGARSAALLVFKALFDIDLSILYGNTSLSQIIKEADEPLNSSKSISRIIKKNGYIQAWQSQRTQKNSIETYNLICMLPDGRIGTLVITWNDKKKEWMDVTAYILSDRNLAEVEEHFKSRGATLITGPISPPIPNDIQ
jgi:hypothetical protein